MFEACIRKLSNELRFSTSYI